MQVRVVKKGVRAGVDKNEVPTNWVWEVDRFITLDDGTETVAPGFIPFTSEELAKHVSAALAAQQVDLAADAKVRDGLLVERDALKVSHDQKEAALKQAKAAILAALGEA